MIAYLVNVAQAFVPAVLVAGFAWALFGRGGRWVWAAAFTGLAIGTVAFGVATSHGILTATRTALAVGAATTALAMLGLLGGRLLTQGRSGVASRLIAGLAVLGASTQAMFAFLAFSADRALTATTVVNTELILNIGALAAGTGLMIALGVLAGHAGRKAPASGAALFALVLAVQAVLWGSEALLGFLQLRVLDVTSLRVSVVARLTAARPLAAYLFLFALAVVAIAGFPWRRNAGVESDRIARRKRRARAQGETRWLRGAVAATSFLVAVLLYHDLYASLPPSLSHAQEVKPDGGGAIRISVASVKDGNLHRFAYITGDGHRVRFFLINKYDAEHVKIGVVFDACMICGDDGYIQRGGEIICIACNVRIFVPSIGKPGGCNPIPLKHQADADAITIAAADLDKGAKYFSEVVAIEVSDPVTGARLINLKAPFNYEYKGRTFFFESRESYDTFRNAPETYAGKVVSRSLRVQGHQHGS